MKPPLAGRAAPRPAAFLAGLFLWVFLAGVLCKLMRAVQLLSEAEAWDGFVWLPLGLCAEILVAAVVVGVVVAVAKIPRLPFVAAAAAGVLLGLANVAWLGVNLTSFAITQAPITFQRLRGDEGVTFAEKSLLTINEIIPTILFAALALLLLAPVAFLLGRRAARVVPRRAVVALLTAAAAGYTFDAFVTRDDNFGVADNPAFTLVSSYVHGALDEHARPVLDDSNKDLADDLAALLVAQTPNQEAPLPPRGRAAMKNVIVIFSEGIARKHTSLAGTEATPNLLRRAKQSGLEFTRYYSPYHKSIAAIYSYVCSDFPPPNAQNIVEINPRIDCGEFSDALADHGIHTALLHGGQFGFYDKLMLLGMRRYELMQDSVSMSEPLKYDENEWGIDDRAMVDHLLAWVDELPPGDRFAATLIPITAHWPYWFPGDVERKYKGVSSKDDYMSAVHFLDEAFEQLMRGLEERGLDKDTAVIFLADHGETVGERPRASAGRRLIYEPSLNVPFVILAPGMWPGGSQSARLGSHVDLLPTILDLLGLPPDARHHGTSLLAPDREPPRVFIGASNGPRWVGFIDGDQKLVVNRTTGHREAYDLGKDPDERHDIVADLPPERVEALTQQALAYADGHLAEIKDAKKRDEEIDIEGRFMEVVDVQLVDDGGRMSPVPPELVKGRMIVGAGKIKHDCVVVTPPPSGSLLLSVQAQPWLPFLTRIRVTQTSAKRDAGVDTVPIETWVDGELMGTRTLTTSGHIRMPFASPSQSLAIRVGGTGTSKRDVCISLSEKGWRHRTSDDDATAAVPADAAVEDAGPPAAAADAGPPRPAP